MINGWSIFRRALALFIVSITQDTSSVFESENMGTLFLPMEIARLIYICYARLIKDFCILVSE